MSLKGMRVDLLLLGRSGRDPGRLSRLVDLLDPSCPAEQAAAWLRDDRELFEDARRQNVAGIIAHRYWPAIQAELPAESADRWKGLLLSTAVVPVRRRDEVRTLLTALVDAGATPVVMRGLWLGETLYPDPGLRPHTDVDLLIPLDRLNQAIEALAQLGYTPLDRLPVDTDRLQRQELRGMHADFRGVCRPAAGRLELSVDLHYALAVVAHGWWPWKPEPAEFYRRSLPWTLHGVPVRCQDSSMALLGLCENMLRHALARDGYGNWLVRLYDLLLLASTFSEDDWELLVQDALRFRLGIPCGLALRAIRDAWGAPCPDNVLQRLLAPPRAVSAARYALGRPGFLGLHGRNALLYAACTGSLPAALTYLARNAGPGIADLSHRLSARLAPRAEAGRAAV